MLKKACHLLVIVLISACGNSEDTSSRPKPRPIIGFSLSGLNDSIWKSGCMVGEDGNSAVVTYTFGDRTLEKVSSDFRGTECAATELRFERIASYKDVSVTNYAAILANSFRARGLLNAVTFTSKHDDFTAELNAANAYQTSSWKTNVPRDVSGLKFDNKSQAHAPQGSVLNVLYSIENDDLYFGYYAADGSLYLDKDDPYTRHQ